MKLAYGLEWPSVAILARARRGDRATLASDSSTTPSRLSVGLKPKDLVGAHWRLAFALQADGWYLRSEIVWHKPNAMPESVKDRPTRVPEHLFLLSKAENYYYDHRAIQEPGINGALRNRRSVWHVETKPFKEAHFATYPPALIEPCILAGSEAGDTILDPFFGAPRGALWIMPQPTLAKGDKRVSRAGSVPQRY